MHAAVILPPQPNPSRWSETLSQGLWFMKSPGLRIRAQRERVQGRLALAAMSTGLDRTAAAARVALPHAWPWLPSWPASSRPMQSIGQTAGSHFILIGALGCVRRSCRLRPAPALGPPAWRNCARNGGPTRSEGPRRSAGTATSESCNSESFSRVCFGAKPA